MCESLKYSPVINQILDATKFLKTEKALKGNRYLATVLLHDFLFTKNGLRQCSKKIKVKCSKQLWTYFYVHLETFDLKIWGVVTVNLSAEFLKIH